MYIGMFFVLVYTCEPLHDWGGFLYAFRLFIWKWVYTNMHCLM